MIAYGIKVGELIAAAKRNPGLKIQILLDFFRAQRTTPGVVEIMNNSVKTLLPLIQSSNNVQLSLYHTPDLVGTLKKLVPPKYNETIGINHLKTFIFDDDLLMSGANLSEDYFTNREDRYITFGDHRELSDFYQEFVSVVAEHSFRVVSSEKLSKGRYELHFGSMFSSNCLFSVNPEVSASKFKQSLRSELFSLFDTEQRMHPMDCADHE